MKEVDAQKLVIDAVKSAGGHGHKLSNRFLVGVVDLLIKLPGQPAMLAEVKLEKRSSFKGQTSDSVYFTPDVTALQWKFLKDYHDAGMTCGLISFVEVGGKGVKGLSMGTFTLDVDKPYSYRRGDAVLLSQHVSLADPVTRYAKIVELLEQTNGE